MITLSDELKLWSDAKPPPMRMDVFVRKAIAQEKEIKRLEGCYVADHQNIEALIKEVQGFKDLLSYARDRLRRVHKQTEEWANHE